MLIKKPPGVSLPVHPVSRRMVWGPAVLKGICSKLVKKIIIKTLIIIGKRDAITPMTEPLTKGGEEETHEGIIARSGLFPMRMRRVQKVVTVPGGMGGQIPKLTIGTKVTHEMLTLH